MIKAKVSNGMVILGLSGENVARLVAGEPILIDLADLDLPPQQVAIVYGKTEDDIRRDITEAVSGINAAKKSGAAQA